MSVDQLARTHYAERQKLARQTAQYAQRRWRRIDTADISGSWHALIAALLKVLTGAQAGAARDAVTYTTHVVRQLGAKPRLDGAVQPDAFAGYAADGRDLADLLTTPLIDVFDDLERGRTAAQALRGGEHRIVAITATQVADAGRLADQTAMAADAKVRGWVRHVSLPACPRCIILAGQFYRHSSGFLRHPNCDCTMIPAIEWIDGDDPEALLRRMRDQHPEALNRSLTDADQKAIFEHGADVNQVVNAHRGMTTAAGLRATTEGATRHGFAGARLVAEQRARGRTRRAPRLTPAAIFDRAESLDWDRDEIVRQLTRFGYLS